MRGFGQRNTEAYCHNTSCQAFNETTNVREVTEYGLTYLEPDECPTCVERLELEPVPVDTILDEIAAVLDEAGISVAHLHKATDAALREALTAIARALQELGGTK